MNAVILAAGRGERLRPITDTAPKCLTLVNGKPILEHELDALDAAGIQECTIVVGYRGRQIKDQFGSRFKRLRLAYLENPDYGTTNNLYSLWLARNNLKSQTILIEGDLVFTNELMIELVNAPAADVAVVDAYRTELNGTVVRGPGKQIQEFILKSSQGTDFDYSDVSKTVNLYKFSKTTMCDYFLPGLDHHVAAQDTNVFYEAVLAEIVADGSLRMDMLSPDGCPWMEIDTLEDLQIAEELFKSPARIPIKPKPVESSFDWGRRITKRSA
jgi:NDP-sugar pyrophosphorylase family protein